MEEPINGTDTDRFWAMTPNTEEEKVYGNETIAIVDESLGGIVLYCHESNVDWIIAALREKEGVKR